MQTFLPYPDAERSAAVLDDRRLGKQRVETLQVLRALHLEGYGWANHPAVTMWRGHTRALVAYGLAVVDAWAARGYADTTRAAIAEFTVGAPSASADPPPWWGHEELHRSHRSALLRKDPAHYRPWFGDLPDDLPYVWPDPPAPSRAPGPRTAWVVRSLAEPDEELLRVPVLAGDRPWVPLDARTGRVPKRARQVARFIDELEVGATVVVPGDGELLVGAVAGAYRVGTHDHVRPVRWCGRLPRTALRFPARLQDPQVVFSLHDEPDVEALVV